VLKDHRAGEIAQHHRQPHIRQVSGIRPNSDLQIRKLFTERVAPRPGVADMFVEINDDQRRG
jgi:hypothetical protein